MHQNDVIYGCDITGYCDRLDITVHQLIGFVKTDIVIMQESMDKLNDFMHPDFDIIYKAMSKKRKHLLRLEEWYSETLGD